MGNQSLAYVDQRQKFKEISSRLGIATPLFVPKPSMGTLLSTSKSNIIGALAGNISQTNHSHLPSAIHGAGATNTSRAGPASLASHVSNRCENESYLDFTRQLLEELDQNRGR